MVYHAIFNNSRHIDAGLKSKKPEVNPGIWMRKYQIRNTHPSDQWGLLLFLHLIVLIICHTNQHIQVQRLLAKRSFKMKTKWERMTLDCLTKMQWLAPHWILNQKLIIDQKWKGDLGDLNRFGALCGNGCPVRNALWSRWSDGGSGAFYGTARRRRGSVFQKCNTRSLFPILNSVPKSNPGSTHKWVHRILISLPVCGFFS